MKSNTTKYITWQRQRACKDLLYYRALYTEYMKRSKITSCEKDHMRYQYTILLSLWSIGLIPNMAISRAYHMFKNIRRKVENNVNRL